MNPDPIQIFEELQSSRNQGFSLLFCLVMEGSVEIITGSGSGGSKILRSRSVKTKILQIQIRQFFLFGRFRFFSVTTFAGAGVQQTKSRGPKKGFIF
jgi:hypothetical protein